MLYKTGQTTIRLPIGGTAGQPHTYDCPPVPPGGPPLGGSSGGPGGSGPSTQPPLVCISCPNGGGLICVPIGMQPFCG